MGRGHWLGFWRSNSYSQRRYSPWTWVVHVWSLLSVKNGTNLHPGVESSWPSIPSLKILFNNRSLIGRCQQMGWDVFDGSNLTALVTEGGWSVPIYRRQVWIQTNVQGTGPVISCICMFLIACTTVENSVDHVCLWLPFSAWKVLIVFLIDNWYVEVRWM